MEKQAKLLYVLKILWEETDESRPMPAQRMVERLSAYGISSERKSIYRDLDVLSEFGFDIIKDRRGAYMASRLLELPELKLLVDAVQASRFITEKKSNELIEKLGVLAGNTKKNQLKRQVYMKNRAKTMNETIYYNIDRIFDAMECGKQISFQYCAWTVKRELKPRRNGLRYVVSPWFLQWENERYYLVSYDAAADSMKHFRVDKMLHIEKCPENRLGQEQYRELDIARYGQLRFGMYQGEYVTVTLLCDNELAGTIIDRFGRDVWIHPVDDFHFRVTLEVMVSDKFFGWMAGFGGRIRIIAPDSLRMKYQKHLENILEKEYREVQRYE